MISLYSFFASLFESAKPQPESVTAPAPPGNGPKTVNLREQIGRMDKPLPARDTGLEEIAAKIDAWGLEWEWSRVVDGALVDHWSRGNGSALEAVRQGFVVRVKPAVKTQKLEGRQSGKTKGVAAWPNAEPELYVELYSGNEVMLRYLVKLLEGMNAPGHSRMRRCKCGSPECPAETMTGLRVSQTVLNLLGEGVKALIGLLYKEAGLWAARHGADACFEARTLLYAADAFLTAARGLNTPEDIEEAKKA